MQINNTTKQTTLATNAVEATSFKDKSIGLLNKAEPTAILFQTRFGIHTFGMKFPIDVLILDKQNQVVKIKEQLKPNQIFLWNPKYKTVLELPSGVIKKSKTEIEDKLLLPLAS